MNQHPLEGQSPVVINVVTLHESHYGIDGEYVTPFDVVRHRYTPRQRTGDADTDSRQYVLVLSVTAY